MAVKQAFYRYRWVILGLSLLCQWSAALAGQMLAPLAPLFQPDLGLSKTEVGLFSSTTFAGAWIVLLVAGSLTDRFGVRKLTSLGQLATGALLLLMSTVGSALQAGVVLFAASMGRGTVFPGSTKAIMDWFSPTSRATAMGVKQTGVPLAGMAVAAILPTLGLAIGWRSAIACVGFAVIAGGIITAFLYRDPPHASRSPGRGASMRAGMGDVLRNRGLWILGCISFLYVIAQMGTVTYLALYFKEIVLVSQVPDERTRIVVAGGFLSLCHLGGIFGRVSWGLISDRVFHGRRLVVLAIIGGLSALVTTAMALIEPDYPLWLLTAIVLAAGATIVSWNGVYHALIAETVGRKHAATGVGFTMTMTEFGTTVGPPLFGLVVDLSGSYATGYLFLTLVSILGTLVAASLARGERHSDQ